MFILNKFKLFGKYKFGIVLPMMVMLVSISIIEYYKVTKGTFEPCNKFRIGDSILYLKMFTDLRYSDSTGEYYLRSSCRESVRYFIDFESNFILPRVSKIVMDYNPYSSLEIINDELRVFGFKDTIDSKEDTITLLNDSGNIKFSLGRYNSSIDYLPIYFTILR